MSVFVAGMLAGVFSIWGSWRVALPATTLAVTRSLFRVSINSATNDLSFTSPQGFYIDDYVREILNSPAPAKIIEPFKTGFDLP